MTTPLLSMLLGAAYGGPPQCVAGPGTAHFVGRIDAVISDDGPCKVRFDAPIFEWLVDGVDRQPLTVEVAVFTRPQAGRCPDGRARMNTPAETPLPVGGYVEALIVPKHGKWYFGGLTVSDEPIEAISAPWVLDGCELRPPGTVLAPEEAADPSSNDSAAGVKAPSFVPVPMDVAWAERCVRACTDGVRDEGKAHGLDHWVSVAQASHYLSPFDSTWHKGWTCSEEAARSILEPYAFAGRMEAEAEAGRTVLSI